MLTINQVKELFENINQTDGFVRVMAEHPLDLFAGCDSGSRETLLLVCNNKPQKLFSSTVIDVSTGKRKDNRWAVSFSLNDSKYFDIFCQFCFDIILSSLDVSNDDDGAAFVCQRYIKWQEMLKKKRGELLSEKEIKGLIGELFFLKNYMIEKFGIREAILSWVGPKRVDQDFVTEDTWYEVKTTTSGSESVKISSIEQLDIEEDGHLVILFLDKTSTTNIHKLTVNSLVDDMINLVSGDATLLTALNNSLIDQGYYYSEEYDEFAYRFNGMQTYEVNSNFKCLRRKEIPLSVKDAVYDLLLSEIDKFKES